MTVVGESITLSGALRSEHRNLRERVSELSEAARALISGRDAPELEELVTWLAEHLVPHADAEEQVLYPAVDAIAGTDLATATMRTDHTEIAARLRALRDDVRRGGPDADVVPALVGLHAVVLLHLQKEEAVLLPFVDEHLDDTSSEDLLRALQEAADEVDVRR